MIFEIVISFLSQTGTLTGTLSVLVFGNVVIIRHSGLKMSRDNALIVLTSTTKSKRCRLNSIQLFVFVSFVFLKKTMFIADVCKNEIEW